MKATITQDEIDAFFGQTGNALQGKDVIVVTESLKEPEYSYDGPVEFPGDVNGNGQVLWIRGTCHFKGSVRNVQVVSLGGLTVDDDCRDSIIHSLGPVDIRRAVNSDVTSYRQIEIRVESEGSSLQTAEDVHAPEATFRSGRLEANGNILINNAHSMGSSGRMLLIAGERRLLIHKIQLIERQHQDVQEQLENTKSNLQKLIKTLIAQNKLGAKVPELDNLKHKQLVLEKLVTGTEMAIQNYRRVFEKPLSRSIQINDTVGRDVYIQVDGCILETSDEYAEVLFRQDGDNVTLEKIKE